MIGGFLLISPTVHPWYLIWIIPFLCFFRSLGWILLTGTIIFARSIYINYEATGSWEETWWAAYCVYVPFYIIIFYNSIKRIIKKKSTNSLYKNDAKQNILKWYNHYCITFSWIINRFVRFSTQAKVVGFLETTVSTSLIPGKLWKGPYKLIWKCLPLSNIRHY